jgi:hypothetical protein
MEARRRQGNFTHRRRYLRILRRETTGPAGRSDHSISEWGNKYLKTIADGEQPTTWSRYRLVLRLKRSVKLREISRRDEGTVSNSTIRVASQMGPEDCDVLCDVSLSCLPLQTPPTRPYRCQRNERKFDASRWRQCHFDSLHLSCPPIAWEIDTVEVRGSPRRSRDKRVYAPAILAPLTCSCFIGLSKCSPSKEGSANMARDLALPNYIVRPASSQPA